MNPNTQLDYVLGRLDGHDRSEAEAEVAGDLALTDRLDRLGQSLRLLLDDGREFEPPPGLAGRTLALVSERSARRAILDFVPARVPFRWADIAVAAGILMATLLTLMPAVRQTRQRMSQAGCGFNLQQLGVGLSNYAIRHNTFPDVHAKGPGTPAGTYALDLSDENLIRDLRALHCPCRGQSPKDETRPDPRLMDYAYHIGYRHPSGRTAPVLMRCSSTVPLLADNPPLDANFRVLPGNSPNHDRRGQNVLFADMHVEFFKTRQVNPHDTDLYLNEQRQPAPGLFPDDSTLVCPAYPIPAH